MLLLLLLFCCCCYFFFGQCDHCPKLNDAMVDLSSWKWMVEKIPVWRILRWVNPQSPEQRDGRGEHESAKCSIDCMFMRWKIRALGLAAIPPNYIRAISVSTTATRPWTRRFVTYVHKQNTWWCIRPNFRYFHDRITNHVKYLIWVCACHRTITTVARRKCFKIWVRCYESFFTCTGLSCHFMRVVNTKNCLFIPCSAIPRNTRINCLKERIRRLQLLRIRIWTGSYPYTHFSRLGHTLFDTLDHAWFCFCAHRGLTATLYGRVHVCVIWQCVCICRLDRAKATPWWVQGPCWPRSSVSVMMLHACVLHVHMHVYACVCARIGAYLCEYIIACNFMFQHNLCRSRRRPYPSYMSRPLRACGYVLRHSGRGWYAGVNTYHMCHHPVATIAAETRKTHHVLHTVEVTTPHDHFHTSVCVCVCVFVCVLRHMPLMLRMYALQIGYLEIYNEKVTLPTITLTIQSIMRNIFIPVSIRASPLKQTTAHNRVWHMYTDSHTHIFKHANPGQGSVWDELRPATWRAPKRLTKAPQSEWVGGA